MEQKEKAYYMQEIEFAVLLTAMGYKQLYGYHLQSMENVEEQQVNQALFSMARKGIILPGEEGFLITGEYRSMLQYLMKATQLLVVADREQRFPELYLYVSDKVVALQSYGQSGIMLKLELWDRTEAVDRLMQWGFCIESSLQVTVPSYGEEAEYRTDTPELFELGKKQLLERREINMLLLDLDIMSRRKNSQIMVLRHGVEDQIVTENRTEMRRYRYSVRTMEAILSQCIGGVK